MTAKSSRIPITTLLLIAANIAAAFIVVLQPDLIEQFAFRADAPSVQTAFTSLFMHQNVIHLLGNMVFLAAVGASVELATGSLRFAIVYFASGLLGVLAHSLMAGPSGVELLGASGCVAGCAAYYSARYYGLRVPLAPHVSISVASVTGVWVALQALGAVVHIGAEASAVSYWSHLGGFIAGLLLSLVFRAPDLGQRALGHAVLDEMNLRGPAATIAAAQHHLKKHPNDPIALWEIAKAAATMDDRELETETLFQLFETAPEGEHNPVLMRLAALGRLNKLPTIQRTMLAERSKSSDPQLCEALLLSVVGEDIEDPQRPEAMLALAGLKWESDNTQAKKIIEQLSKTYPLHAAVELARVRGWMA